MLSRVDFGNKINACHQPNNNVKIAFWPSKVCDSSALSQQIVLSFYCLTVLGLFVNNKKEKTAVTINFSQNVQAE